MSDVTVAGPSLVDSRPLRGGTPLERGAVIGRYVILSKLGEGGMGVVYAAYDPELDRKVALKMLLADLRDGPTHTEGRGRLLREAQALAKLAHPEIVGVHDVGEHEAGVWLAMELVDGRTLGAWAKESHRGWTDILHVMLGAGRGVAAAHAAGLVHRDLKPDNIMVAHDGRVRVMDFGLTRPETGTPETRRSSLDQEPDSELAPLTRAGSLLGTPAYMAPEQFAGIEVTAAADQFAFCVTLWELLFGERPFAGRTVMELAAAVIEGQLRVPAKARGVPRWLRRTCERGLARDPAQRWPTMQALLDELGRGRSRARSRNAVIALGLLATIVAGAEGYRRVDRAQRIAACEAEGAAIGEVWNDDAHADVRAGLLATGMNSAEVTADKVMPFLDEQARAWTEHRTAACLNAEVHETWDSETLGRSVWCLDERRLEFAELVIELGHADGPVGYKAVSAAAGLTKVSPCIDEAVLRNLPQPPSGDSREAIVEVRAELARARTLGAAGKYTDGVELAKAASDRAALLEWPPLSAVAHQHHGLLLMQAGRYTEAEVASRKGYTLAARASAWQVAADAALELATNLGHRQARTVEGRTWAAHAEVAIAYAGDPLGVLEAARLNTLASIHIALGEYEDARVDFAAAAILRERAFGPDHPVFATALGNLASAHHTKGEYAEAKALHERALAISERALGPEHPGVAMALNNLGVVHDDLGLYPEAQALYERALAIWEQALGPDHPDVAIALDNLGVVHKRLGHYEQATRYHERALAIHEKSLGPKHPDVAINLNNLAGVHSDSGEYEQARALYERAVAIWDEALGPDHPDTAVSLKNLADIHGKLGEHEQAKVLYVRALAIKEKAFGPDHLKIATNLIDLGDVELALDHPAAAVAAFERALAIYAVQQPPVPEEQTTRLSLARALLAAG